MTDRPGSADAADPVGVLREAIGGALVPLQHTEAASEGVHAVLATFATAVSPVLDQLAELAEAEPGGSVDTALRHLRRAFNHRGTGTISPSCRWQLQRAHDTLLRHAEG